MDYEKVFDEVKYVIFFNVIAMQVLYNKFRNKEEHPKCCTSCTIKCWRHYLEEVQIDGGESRAEIDRIMAMPELELSDASMECEVECKVRFILKWRS